MAQPGWYPDPAGAADLYRYWDGAAWTDETRPVPAPPVQAPPPPPPSGPPPPPQQPAPSVAPTSWPQYQPTSPPPPGPPDQTTPWSTASGGTTPSSIPTAVVAVVAVLVALAGVAGFLIVDGLVDNVGDETRAPEIETRPSPQAPSGGEACVAGSPEGGAAVAERMRGGGLTMPTPQGYTPAGFEWAAVIHTFANRVAVAGREVQADKWISNYALGGLPREPYDDLQDAAETVIGCMAQSPSFFESFESRDELSSEQIEVDGHKAWQVTSEIRVDDPGLEVEGDQVSVVVVDTGTPQTYGLLVSVVPIGDERLIKQQGTVIKSLEISVAGQVS